MSSHNDSIDLPWDPLWEYLLGEEEGKQKSKRWEAREQQQEGGFLSYLFPEEETRDDSSWHKIRQHSVSRNQGEKREESGRLIRLNSNGSNQSSPKPKAKSKKFWKRNKRPSQDESNAWEWQFDPAVTGGLSEATETKDKRTSEPTTKNKREHRVRFAPFNSSPKAAKDEGPDYRQRFRETTEIAAVELQKSQKSLLDWVGITDTETLCAGEEVASSDKDSEDNPQVKFTLREEAKQPTTLPPPENNSFPFVGLLNNWGDTTSSEDGSSLASTFGSTQGSGTVTSTEEESMFTDDEEDSKLTDQSEISVLNPENEEDYSEVVLAFKPAAPEASNANLLPILEDDNSVDIEKYVYVDGLTDSSSEDMHEEPQETLEDSETEKADEHIEGFNSILEELEEFNEMRGAKKDLHETVVVKPPPAARVPRRSMCRSVKSLSCQQMKWSAESGLPFHELSQKELAALFPKVRSVQDDQEGESSELIRNSDTFTMKVPVHLQAALQHSGPQSLFEYEYETGVHMFVSYYDFGDNVRSVMKVETAPTPPPRSRKGSGSLNKIMVQVEASTVSQTDCLVRQGKWWGTSKVTVPNSPGVDVVGKLYRVDKESTKRYNLSKGDRVLSLVKWGGNSRYLSVDPSQLVKVPESVDPAEAACLVETYLAAFQILHLGQNEASRYRENSLKGKTILILGYSLSNMGRAIAQVAACASAAQVYALAKPKHFQQLEALGIEPLNKESLEWWDALNKNVDVIISLGEKVVTLHYKCLKPGGQVVIAQNHKKKGQGKSTFSSRKNLVGSFKKWKQQSKTFTYDIYEAWEKNLGQCKNDLQYLILALEQKQLAPKLLDRIPLGKVARAQELIESKQLPGFIICEPWLVAKSRAIRV